MRGYLAMGGAALMVCSMGGAGVVAVANEACLQCEQTYGVRAGEGFASSCLGLSRNRGGIVGALNENKAKMKEQGMVQPVNGINSTDCEREVEFKVSWVSSGTSEERRISGKFSAKIAQEPNQRRTTVPCRLSQFQTLEYETCA